MVHIVGVFIGDCLVLKCSIVKTASLYSNTTEKWILCPQEKSEIIKYPNLDEYLISELERLSQIPQIFPVGGASWYLYLCQAKLNHDISLNRETRVDNILTFLYKLFEISGRKHLGQPLDNDLAL